MTVGRKRAISFAVGAAVSCVRLNSVVKIAADFGIFQYSGKRLRSLLAGSR